ncbi:MAG: hypothetical protein JWN48_4484 [Myxococcaceae bacterium]|nr:hypothetical protein [Myxococcaceae bacterium]
MTNLQPPLFVVRQRLACVLLLSLTGTLYLLYPHLAWAESLGDSPAYRSTVEHALEEFDAGNYAEARSLLVRAHELYPSARTFRGLGLVAFELRNYNACVDYLEAALASSTKPLTDTQRSQTEEVLARARAFIARVSLQIAPKTTRVLVDGLPVELSDSETLPLEVGDHLLEFQASGYLSEKRALSVAGGERITLRVVMHRPELSLHTGYASALRDGKHDRGRRWYRSPWLWTGAGLVLTGAAVGLAFALRPDSKIEIKDPVATRNTPPGGVLQSLGNWR